MAPRQPKPKPFDDASATPSPLKPKTEKAKVEKAKSDNSKADKTTPPTSATGEKVKVTKPKATKITATAGDDEDGEGMVKTVKAKIQVKKTPTGEKDVKEKVKSVTGDEAVELILRYLKEQNRPYSATEISANLHGKVSKTVADKLLKEMEQNNLIMAKATNGTNKGSQWVFWAKQDVADAASPEELAVMGASIATIRESLPALKYTLKILATKLQALRSAPTLSQLASMVDTLRAENKIKKEKLRGFKDGSVKMVTKEEMEKVEKDFKYWASKRRARMNAYKSLEAHLLEGMSKEDIEEKVGVEADTYGA